MRRPEPSLARRHGLRAAGFTPPVILALAGGLAALSADGRGIAQDAVGVDGARASLERMVETRRLISRERTDWALGQELLQRRVAVVGDEIAALRARIAETEASISEADRKREELMTENEALKASSAGLASMVTSLEERTMDLLVRLPAPIQERVKPLSQRFPEDPAASSLSLSARFQNVIGVLNEVNKFNREVTVVSERRTINEGLVPQQVEVAAMYVGVAYGFYATSDGRHAGSGTATDAGWTWTEQDQAAAFIQRAIAILQSEDVADFVPLPITID